MGDLYRRLRKAMREAANMMKAGRESTRHKRRAHVRKARQAVGASLRTAGVLLLLCLSACASASGCDINELQLVDVSCAPPHGNGPDGRAWFKLQCGAAKTPTPFDWQLTRPLAVGGDIFAWEDDPLYAYVEAEPGSFQASAHTVMGQLSLNFEFPASCAGRVKRVR